MAGGEGERRAGQPGEKRVVREGSRGSRWGGIPGLRGDSEGPGSLPSLTPSDGVGALLPPSPWSTA